VTSVSQLHKSQQYCLQLPMYAENVALLTFARRTPLREQSIDILPTGPTAANPQQRVSRFSLRFRLSPRITIRSPCMRTNSTKCTNIHFGISILPIFRNNTTSVRQSVGTRNQNIIRTNSVGLPGTETAYSLYCTDR